MSHDFFYLHDDNEKKYQFITSNCLPKFYHSIIKYLEQIFGLIL